MPAFTFEKISPPADRGPIPPVANKKQRGVIVQMLDRFAEARVKRTLKEEKGVIARNRSQTSRLEFQFTLRSNRLLQPSMRRCRTGTSPRAR